MRNARLIGGAVLAALAITATALIMGASPASADTQIGWVLDASGSAQCVVKSGTSNHVVCYHYPPGGGASSVVVDDWVIGACLGGAYMVAGNNAGQPAQIVYRNVSGFYCGRDYNVPSVFHGGACNIEHSGAGTFSNYYGQTQAGNYFPYNASGGSWGANCSTVGASVVGHFIYYT